MTKLAYFLSSLALAPAVSGFTAIGIKSPIGTKSNLHYMGRFKDGCWSEKEAQKAFDELADELYRDRKERRARSRFYRNGRRGPPFDGSMVDDDIDKEAFIRRQKEWINKAFDLASDLNENFSSSEKEMKENEEAIKNAKEWFATATGKSSSDPEDPVSVQSPIHSVQDDEDTFQITMDVPGVQKSDIDISFKEDIRILTISGVRYMTTSDPDPSSTRFSKDFGPLDEAIETDKIGAKLENGVLVVTAPKKQAKDSTPSKKIAIT